MVLLHFVAYMKMAAHQIPTEVVTMLARLIVIVLITVKLFGMMTGAANSSEETRVHSQDSSTDLDIPLGAKSSINASDVERLRKAFPYESIAPRLGYESRLQKSRSISIDPQETAVVEKTIVGADKGLIRSVRSQKLEMLHTMKVEEFIEADGFGNARMQRGEAGIFPAPSKLIVFDSVVSANTDGDHAKPTYRLPGDSREGIDTDSEEWLLPRYSRVLDFHTAAQAAFADPWNFGHVVDRDRVAGFTSHGFTKWHGGPPDDAQSQPDFAEQQLTWRPEVKRWKVARLELVSLLRYVSPRVYVSDRLPDMKELHKSMKTRAMDEFETVALAELVKGEEIQTMSTPNRIVMLGAIRAGNQCIQCHSVPRGALLGAFTYDLRRDPPHLLQERDRD